MRCEGCGGERFVSTEYNLGASRAPALECASCHVLVLEEGLARSEDERLAIRQAMALREAVRRSSTRTIADAQTVPLMPAARAVPDQSGNFKVSCSIYQKSEETGIPKSSRRR